MIVLVGIHPKKTNDSEYKNDAYSASFFLSESLSKELEFN
jgi:hypothetical protein